MDDRVDRHESQEESQVLNARLDLLVNACDAMENVNDANPEGYSRVNQHILTHPGLCCEDV